MSTATPVALPWSGAVDRQTGGLAADPSDFDDLRNIVFAQAAVKLRAGAGPVAATVGGDVVCHAEVFKALGKLIFVVYTTATRAVDVYETDLQGNGAALVGNWGTLDNDAAAPPRFFTAESFAVLVLAHDEPDVTHRLETMRYDPAAGTVFAVVQADLDGGGAADTFFRGVREHYGYIFAWGFGSATDPDRPETVRVSAADDPTSFDAQHYYLVGARTEPVLACIPVGKSLAVFKGSSWHRIDGTNRATWELVLVDPLFGIAASRSAINLYGRVYWESPFGPRATDGASTVDLSQPLDLGANPPETLPLPGQAADIWAAFEPEWTMLLWGSPNYDDDTTLITALSLRQPDRPRWVFWTLPFAAPCALLLQTGQAAVLVPPGYADNVTVTGSIGDASAAADVVWDNVDCVGDETVEVWFRMNAGAWALGTTVPVNTSGPQTATLTSGLVSGTIDVAIRHRRLGRYLTGYEGADPGAWPPASQGSGTIVVIPVPTAIAATYDPTTGALDINWAISDPTVDQEVRLVAYFEVPVTFANPNGILGVAFTSSNVSVLAGTTNWNGTSFGAAVSEFPTPVLWLPWAGNTIVGANALAACRAQGLRVLVQVRGKVGGITGAWGSATTYPFIGFNSTPTIAGVWQTNSVSLGTKVSVSWGTGQAYRVGAVSVRELMRSFPAATPANGGGCNAIVGFVQGLAVDVFDSTDQGTNPAVVDAPFCATCYLVGQTVELRSTVAREQINNYGFTQWTLTTQVAAAPGSAVCGF